MGFTNKTLSIKQEKKTSKKRKVGDCHYTSEISPSQNATAPKPIEKCKLIKRTTQVKKTIVAKAMSQHNKDDPAADAFDECAICREGFCTGDEKGFLLCGHYFHRRCIEQWFGANIGCPVCGDVPFVVNVPFEENVPIEENVPSDDNVPPETRVGPTSWVSAISWSNFLSSCRNVKLFLDRVERAYDQWIAVYRCMVLLRWIVLSLWELATIQHRKKPKFQATEVQSRE